MSSPFSGHSAATKGSQLVESRPVARQGFALVLTLLILSLLIIVVVSYLSGASSELQTANAYASKVRATDAAQAAVDAATSILAESFRDFPDSATVWDTQQSINYGTPTNSAIVNSAYNEGTSLYLRAVPSAQDSTGYALALPSHVNYVNGTPSYASNDPNGNTPSNNACKNFVMPLISGMPYGHARLSSARTQYYSSSPTPTSYDTSFPPPMNLNEPDPTKQNWADLNVRRSSGDIQGAIGSPPGWNGVGPKPARAYWINLMGSNGLVTGRYAFWIDDESFRANNNLLGSAAMPADNNTRPLDTNGKPRVELPGDLTLFGPLTSAHNSVPATLDPASTATSIVGTRTSNVPGSFFPDPLGFSHASAFGAASTTQTNTIDALRYLTTNQSGALNLSRHGSQRLNLNATISTTTTTSVIQTQVNQLVQTLEFHLPYFGERFYRTSANSLNDATQVPGSPYAGSYSSATDGSHSQIYHYKVAANLRDYVDTDCQPTMIGSGGVVMGAPENSTLGDRDDTPAEQNEIWAQGKESAPFIEEVAVRYRPVVTTVANATATNPKGHYYMYADYYIEVWNMSDRDITAAQMGSPVVWIRDQQPWTAYTNNPTFLLEPDGLPPNGEPLSNNHTPNDTEYDLMGSPANPVKDATGAVCTNGVVFRAGAMTIITSDPNAGQYKYQELTATGYAYGKTNFPTLALPNPSNVFICPVISGSRIYSGKITNTDGTSVTTNGGLELGGDFLHVTPYTGTEISIVNSQGYFDVVRGAITKTGNSGYYVYTNTDKYVGQQGNYNDFSFGSSLMGNVTDTNGGPSNSSGAPTAPNASPSQVGDPRTNNEQLWVSVPTPIPPAKTPTADSTCFMAATRTLGVPNYPEVQPDITTAGPGWPNVFGWPDYYKFPAANASSAHPSPDATTAPAVIAGETTADGPLTSIGQLGDIFDPARVPNPSVTPVATSILYSHGGGRTFKIGQHDDLYSDDPTTNVPATSGNTPINTADNVPASSGWASWRLADIFDVADPIELPGQININGVTRDNGAALLAALQGFNFQPVTASGTADPVIHGDATAGLAGTSLDTTGTKAGFSQLVAQMRQRLDANTASRVKPFFERGELGELGVSSGAPLFGTNPTASSSANNALVASVDMNKTTDHSREEMFRRMAQMICTRGNTFTVYAVGQSILQTSASGPLKITGTQQMRVTFQLAPKARNPTTGAFADFHPAYTTNADGSINTVNSIDPANPNEPLTNGQIGVIARFAKPDRYDPQTLQAIPY